MLFASDLESFFSLNAFDLDLRRSKYPHFAITGCFTILSGFEKAPIYFFSPVSDFVTNTLSFDILPITLS